MRKHITYILSFLFLFVATTVTAQDDAFYNRLENLGYDIVNIENSGVMQYLNDNAYENQKQLANYSFSVVRKYSKGVPSRPAGITLKWNSATPIGNISQLIVTLVETDEERDESILEGNLSGQRVRYYYPDIKSREYVLCNMQPHKYFYYKVEELQHGGQRTLLKKGKFYSDGQIRMLRVDGMANVRDFGGWETTFGVPVAYGRIFRGNNADRITSTGKNDLVKNEHITADLDLRGGRLSKSPMGELNEVEYYCTNNYRYKYALTGHTEVLVKNLETLAKVLRNGGNAYLHCEHGCNRAGTLSFVIEGLLGFTEADLTRDYELSSFAYGIARSNVFGAMLPIIRSYGKSGDDLAQCFYNFARSKGASEDTLDTIRCIMLNLSPNDPRILNAHKR